MLLQHLKQQGLAMCCAVYDDRKSSLIIVGGFSFSSDIAPLSCPSITDAILHEAPTRLRVREATRFEGTQLYYHGLPRQ